MVQMKRSSRTKNSFVNFKKTSASNMTRGACISRMEQLQTIYAEFEKDQDLLMESDEIDSNDEYFVSDYFSIIYNPIQYWDHWIVFLTVGRLSPLCQRKWEETVAHSDNPQEPPTFARLENCFMLRYCHCCN